MGGKRGRFIDVGCPLSSAERISKGREFLKREEKARRREYRLLHKSGKSSEKGRHRRNGRGGGITH